MFSSINFLFLISLAVTTWIILCYFKQIELQREEQMTVEIQMDKAFEENLKSKGCLENYDIYLNFLAVFACIYALAKVTSVAESYVAQQVHARIKHAKLFSSKDVEPTTIEEYRLQHIRLTMQIDYLEQKVNQLEKTNFMLGEKRLVNADKPTSANKMHTNGISQKETINEKKALSNDMTQACVCGRSSSAVGSIDVGGAVCGSIGTVHGKGDTIEDSVEAEEVLNFRNVLIQYHHFQLTRQVYVNDGNVKLQFQDFNQEGGTITQIWQKYLEMQKYAIQKPTSSETATKVANTVPIVVSTEELQTMKGRNRQSGKRQPLGCVLTNSNNMEY
ncbi:uncharacterized protein LOC129242542 isoform X2 [Anastrepha obliqua]|uniref:uncharacterized protein LOC129242542 isoform X2 n=1 Tax=Anastrepha obliqua TaxID=95512 RepID=UPI00240A7F8C|nr:uncharacterized protein LOC129242542 isoform X2 [Anastrepha obliqua]